MPNGYYLACLETHRYVWIGTLGNTTSAAGVDADLVSSFCLVHRGKSLIVISESHQVLEEGHEWRFDLRNAQIARASSLSSPDNF
jgi:hypothetical protein